MSMLSRAAAKFEKTFVALPPSTKQAVALAMYRAAPAIQQYQKDLAPLAEDPAVTEAVWDIAIAVAFRLVRGRDAFGEKQMAEMKAAAPETADFCIQVGRLIAGMLPGMGAPLALPALPTLEIVEDEA